MDFPPTTRLKVGSLPDNRFDGGPGHRESTAGVGGNSEGWQFTTAITYNAAISACEKGHNHSRGCRCASGNVGAGDKGVW